MRGWKTAQYDHNSTEAEFSEARSYCKGIVGGGGKCLYAEATQLGTGCGKCTGVRGLKLREIRISRLTLEFLVAL